MDPIVRARDLGRRYLDGCCNSAERAELEQLLLDHPGAADAFANLSRLESDLSALFSEEPGRRRETEILEAIERHQARRRWLARGLRLAVAAVLLMLVGGPLLWWLARPGHQPAPAGYAVLQGQVEVAGKMVDHPRAGDRLLVVGSEPATLRLSDGSRAWLQPDSRVVLHGSAPGVSQRIELEAGEGRFSVRPRGEEFRVETSVGTVTALGTEFNVELRPDKGDQEMKQRMLLAVMVFSGLVEVVSSDGSHLLGVGESRLFGQERTRETERRPETRMVWGSISEIKGSKLTISVGRRTNSTEETIEVGASVKILIDGKPGKLTALAKGMMIRLTKNDKDELLGISVEGPTMDALVKSVEEGKITLARRSRDPNEENPTYPVAADARILLDRKPVKLTDLKAGMRVMLKLSSDRKTVVAINLGGERRGGPSGEIKEVDEKGKTITLAARGGERKFTLAEEVKVIINGKPGKLADLKVGANASLLLDSEGKTVRGISVGVRSRPNPSLRGAVSEVKDRQLTIAVRSRQGNTEETITIPEKSKVLVDGKPGKLSDLPKGAIVEIAKDEKGVVIGVSATGATVSGIVKSLADGKLTLVKRGRDPDAEEPTWTVTADATVIIDGKPAKLAEVKADMPVVVRLSIDGKSVVEIRHNQRPPNGVRR